jgi:hypothetical protein
MSKRLPCHPQAPPNLMEQNHSEFDPWTLPAPRWVTTIAYFLRLGLGLFLAVSIALSLLLSGCSAQASGFWSNATSILDSDQVRAIVADHSSLPSHQISDGWLKKVKAHREGNLLLIDFNSDRLCGQGGCLYVGYLLDQNSQKLSEVLSIRLKPQLPSGISLFEIDPSQATEPPCLKIHQQELPQRLIEYTFCFNETEYVKQSTIAKPI